MANISIEKHGEDIAKFNAVQANYKLYTKVLKGYWRK